MTNLVESHQAPDWSTSLLIDGREEPGHGPDLKVFNPATEHLLASVAQADADQVNRAVAAARRAFDRGAWPGMSPAERSTLLHAFADHIESMHDELAAGCVAEIGTPITMSATMQTRGAVAAFRVYADLAGRDWTENLGEHVGAVRSRGQVNYLPTGVVGVITAYNIPLAIAARSMGGALAAGCTVVLLPSPRAPLTTLLMSRAALLSRHS